MLHSSTPITPRKPWRLDRKSRRPRARRGTLRTLHCPPRDFNPDAAAEFARAYVTRVVADADRAEKGGRS